LSPEQRKELQKFEEERRVEQEKRIETLEKKLRDRIRPFVEASKPGDADDPETQSFMKRIKEEAEDLKLESFGVEMCRLIGTIYVSKSGSFMKFKKGGPFQNFLGVPAFWGRLKDKGSTIKEGWSFLTSTVDVQVAMEDIVKKQEKGGIDETEMRMLEMDLSAKLLLVSWKGTAFEVSNIIKEVVSRVLREHGVSEQVLLNRAKAILVIGGIFKAVEPDETDEERRELERLVAEISKKKSRKPKSGTSTPTPDKPASPSAVSSG